MKKIIYIMLLIILNITVVQAQDLQYRQTQNINNEVTEMIDNQDIYLTLNKDGNNTIVKVYSKENELQITKKIENLKKSQIIKYHDNYLLSGISSNMLKVYLLDSNLKVIKQVSSTYFINAHDELKIYTDLDKCYIFDMNGLFVNDIYEVGSDLTISKNKLSSYNGELLKNILKSDYYLIHSYKYEEFDIMNAYQKATYMDDKNILVGESKNITKGNTYAIMTIVDKNGDKIKDVVNEEFRTYKDVLVVNDKFVLLAIASDDKYSLLIYDKDFNNVDKINLDIAGDVKISKVLDKVLIYNKSKIMEYSFDVVVNKSDDVLGTINILSEDIKPYQEVKVKVEPNSGYKVKEIIVKDSQGNLVNVEDGHFIMPNSSVLVSAEYKQTVHNPNTADKIFIISAILIGFILLSIYLYRKLSWLK